MCVVGVIGISGSLLTNHYLFACLQRTLVAWKLGQRCEKQHSWPAAIWCPSGAPLEAEMCLSKLVVLLMHEIINNVSRRQRTRTLQLLVDVRGQRWGECA